MGAVPDANIHGAARSVGDLHVELVYQTLHVIQLLHGRFGPTASVKAIKSEVKLPVKTS
ncbi:hypothetical protein GCM10009835_05840 [Planosporangium flavigriseum]